MRDDQAERSDASDDPEEAVAGRDADDPPSATNDGSDEDEAGGSDEGRVDEQTHRTEPDASRGIGPSNGDSDGNGNGNGDGNGDGDDGGFARSTYLVLVVAGLLVGTLVAPVAVSVTNQPSADRVAIIPLAGSIEGGSAQAFVTQVERARQNPSVKAVVIRVNSGGGAASASETMYLAVKRLAEEKPVVVSVDGIAASGAYYASAPAEMIYAKPASIVGSVGTFAPIQANVEPNDVIAATGPDKLGTDDVRDFKYTVEMVKRSFVNAVVQNRADRLNLSRAELTEAGIFVGSAAAQNGMVDEVGGFRTAVTRAADLAGLEEYTVTVYRPGGPARFVSRAAFVSSDAPNKTMVSPRRFTGIDEKGSSYGTILMMPPQMAYASVDDSPYVGAGAYAPTADGPGTPVDAIDAPDAEGTGGSAPGVAANASTGAATGDVGGEGR